jgi:uncharacterized protein YkwD
MAGEHLVETPGRSAAAGRAPGRRRRWLATAVALLSVGLLSGVLTSCESTKAELDHVRNLVNQSRVAAGVPPVAENVALDIKADRWAQTMRNECRIWHSNLADGAPKGWRKLGENVGMGANIDQIHVAYMNSPGHRANVLDASFTEMGTAAVWGDCQGRRTIFTVHVFMRS